MKCLRYWLLDVFTEQPFGGNQLAVFTDEVLLPTETMQTIAKELNLSETVFVLPGSTPSSKRLRIFTPNTELPMAGHPTIGTAYLLAAKGMIPVSPGSNHYIFEENVGNIEVLINQIDGKITTTEMIQPIPTFYEPYSNPEKIAELLSLDIEDIDNRYPIQTVSAGVPFLYIPVRTLHAMNNIQLRLDIWKDEFSKLEETSHIFAFTLETTHKESHVHSRMFAPAMGISEDPATGSASGPLGCYIVTYGLIEGNQGHYHMISEQGIQMNRPSFISIKIQKKHEMFHKVSIGGASIIVGTGELYL